MEGVFSALSGHFGKPLVLGSLVPVSVALFLFVALVSPPVPLEASFVGTVPAVGNEWRVVELALVTLVLSVLMYNLNTPIVRMYEGYVWQKSWIGEGRTRHFQREFDVLQSRRKNLLALLARPSEKPLLERLVRSRLARVVELQKRDYPSIRSSVLPTRLGNVIRSFENYPRDQYGMSAITLWPRLVAVIPENYAGAIAESKTALDFLINSSLLAGVLSLAVLAFGSPVALSGESWISLGFRLSAAFMLAVVSFLFYRLSISQAVAWGSLVRGAFDLYRWDLLERMGFGLKPRTPIEERELWLGISRQLLFGDKETGPWVESYGNAPDRRATAKRVGGGGNGD